MKFATDITTTVITSTTTANAAFSKALMEKTQSMPDPTTNTPIGICLEICKTTTKDVMVDITITRITNCSCMVCRLNDAFYKGNTMFVRLTDNADRIKVVVCPTRSTFYALTQTVYRQPDGAVLVADYEAMKHRIFKPNKIISAFKEDKTPDNHVKVIYIDSYEGLQLWTPMIVNEILCNADSYNTLGNMETRTIINLGSKQQ